LSPIIAHPETLLCSRIRKSPFFMPRVAKASRCTAATTTPTTPRHYGDQVEEHPQLLNGVTLWDVSVERQVEIAGPDAQQGDPQATSRDARTDAAGVLGDRPQLGQRGLPGRHGGSAEAADEPRGEPSERAPRGHLAEAERPVAKLHPDVLERLPAPLGRGARSDSGAPSPQTTLTLTAFGPFSPASDS
jgi:hypothetical protein